MGSQGGPNRTAKIRQPASQELLSLALDRGQGAAPLYLQVRDGVRALLLAGTIGPVHAPAGRAGDGRRAGREPHHRDARLPWSWSPTAWWSRGGSAGTVVRTPGRAGRRSQPWLQALPALGEGRLGPEPTLLRDVAAASGRPGVAVARGRAPTPELQAGGQLRECLDEALGALGPRRHGLPAGRGLRPPAGDPREPAGGRPDGRAPGRRAGGLGARRRAWPWRRGRWSSPATRSSWRQTTYVGTLQTFALAGARLVGVPVDAERQSARTCWRASWHAGARAWSSSSRPSTTRPGAVLRRGPAASGCWPWPGGTPCRSGGRRVPRPRVRGRLTRPAEARRTPRLRHPRGHLLEDRQPRHPGRLDPSRQSRRSPGWPWPSSSRT